MITHGHDPLLGMAQCSLTHAGNPFTSMGCANSSPNDWITGPLPQLLASSRLSGLRSGALPLRGRAGRRWRTTLHAGGARRRIPLGLLGGGVVHAGAGLAGQVGVHWCRWRLARHAVVLPARVIAAHRVSG